MLEKKPLGIGVRFRHLARSAPNADDPDGPKSARNPFIRELFPRGLHFSPLFFFFYNFSIRQEETEHIHTHTALSLGDDMRRPPYRLQEPRLPADASD